MECNCNTIATISIRFWKEDRRYNRGSVPFALSSNSALIFNVNIGILSEIQNDLKKETYNCYATWNTTIIRADLSGSLAHCPSYLKEGDKLSCTLKTSFLKDHMSKTQCKGIDWLLRSPLRVFPQVFSIFDSWSILEIKIQCMYIMVNLYTQIFILLTYMYVHNIYTMLQAFFSFFFSIWEIRHALAFFFCLPFQHLTLRPFLFIKTVITKTCMKTKKIFVHN